MISVKSVNDYEEHFKALIYGKGGTRKTTFASTAPNPIWVDFERSTDTLRHLGKGDIKLIRPKKMSEVLELVKELPKLEFQTVVFDTATRLQLFHMTEHMKEVIAKASNRDEFLPYQADYRKSGTLLDSIFARLQDMNIHVIVIAHEKIIIDEETKKVIVIRPDLTPRLADAVGGLLNVVAYSEIKPGLNKQPGTQIMHFNQHGKIVAKNRLNITEPIENPTFDKVFTERKN